MTLCHHHLLSEGSLLKAVAASSCGTASHCLHMVTHDRVRGGSCSCWTISLLSKEQGDSRQQVSQISTVPLLLDNATLDTIAVINSETSLLNSSLETLAADKVIATGNKFQFPREISSKSIWIPIQVTHIQDIHANILQIIKSSSRSRATHSPEDSFWSPVALTTEIFRYLGIKA